MNLVEELKSLDINDVGRWPFLFRAAVIAVIFRRWYLVHNHRRQAPGTRTREGRRGGAQADLRKQAAQGR